METQKFKISPRQENHTQFEFIYTFESILFEKDHLLCCVVTQLTEENIFWKKFNKSDDGEIQLPFKLSFVYKDVRMKNSFLPGGAFLFMLSTRRHRLSV